MVALGFGALIYQAKQTPKMNAPYVALGSSYAAGVGLGPRAPGSPWLCGRSGNGYPQQLARLMGLSLSDMSCGGGTVENVLKGGQFFMGPQIDAIGPDTKLVTLTAGGNDINYVGDLMMLSYTHRPGISGFIARRLGKSAKPAQDRDFGALQDNIVSTVREIMRRASPLGTMRAARCHG
jgi:lysophospholipase L1-like esterase